MAGVGGGDGYFHSALLGGVYVGWRGIGMWVCNDAKCREQHEDVGQLNHV